MESSQLCSICQQIPLRRLLFEPDDGTTLLADKSKAEWHVNSSLLPSLGTLAELIARSKTCSLCAMIARIFRKRVANETLSFLMQSSDHKVSLSFATCGSFKRNIERPPHTRSLLGLNLTCCTIPRGPSGLADIDLGEAVQGAMHKLPTVVDSLLTSGAWNPRSFDLRPSGRLFGPICEVNLFTRWLAKCEYTHKTCRTFGGEDPIAGTLRLVDVHDMHLLSFQGDSMRKLRYITLSYVWNMDLSNFFLTKKRLPQYQARGGLQSVDLPRTISDTLKLVRALGERYVWIDSLCIIQDDRKDQMSLIPMMRRIYLNSLLTVVAASGENSNSGLCGLQNGDRNFNPETVVLDDMALI